MQPNIVLLQSDSGTARSLSTLLSKYSYTVQKMSCFSELRSSVARQSAQIVVLDLEVASLSEVKLLTRDFPEVHIICNHRLADESMWTAALSAGAADCCLSSDSRSILDAALRHAAFPYQAAA